MAPAVVVHLEQHRERRARGWFRCNNAIFDTDLSAHAKVVYIYLARCAGNTDQRCFPSYRDIALKVGISHGSVVKALQELDKAGFIERRRRHNARGERTSTEYTLVSPSAAPRSSDPVREAPHGQPVTVVHGHQLAAVHGQPVTSKKTFTATSEKDLQETSPPTPRSAGGVAEAWLALLNAEAKAAFQANSTTLRRIKKRIREGYTLEQAVAVVKHQVAKWQGTNRAFLLRPSTVFGSEFDSYWQDSRRPPVPRVGRDGIARDKNGIGFGPTGCFIRDDDKPKGL